MFGLGFLEVFPLVLIFVSLFGIITTNNAIKTIIYMTILNAGVITFWIILGSEYGTTTLPPIMVDDIISQTNYLERMADPLPSALMITAIVIGFAVTAVLIIILISIFRRYRSTDWRVIVPLAKKDYKGEFKPFEEDIPATPYPAKGKGPIISEYIKYPGPGLKREEKGGVK
ncbi:MAG: cation:proton antiporter subunit C [Defluviitaleaceae bacterium]|nr:cation:proton antiporter subunit C [Defluviitaleaceae bacterium]